MSTEKKWEVGVNVNYTGIPDGVKNLTNQFNFGLGPFAEPARAPAELPKPPSYASPRGGMPSWFPWVIMVMALVAALFFGLRSAKGEEAGKPDPTASVEALPPAATPTPRPTATPAQGLKQEDGSGNGSSQNQNPGQNQQESQGGGESEGDKLLRKLLEKMEGNGNKGSGSGDKGSHRNHTRDDHKEGNDDDDDGGSQNSSRRSSEDCPTYECRREPPPKKYKGCGGVEQLNEEVAVAVPTQHQHSRRCWVYEKSGRPIPLQGDPRGRGLREHLDGFRLVCGSGPGPGTWVSRHSGELEISQMDGQYSETWTTRNHRDEVWLEGHKANQGALIGGVAMVASAGIIRGGLRGGGGGHRHRGGRGGPSNPGNPGGGGFTFGGRGRN